MSNKELAIQLLNNVPPYKLGYVVSYLQGLTADEDADDLFCESLMQDYDGSEHSHDTISLDTFAQELGLNPSELRGRA